MIVWEMHSLQRFIFVGRKRESLKLYSEYIIYLPHLNSSMFEEEGMMDVELRRENERLREENRQLRKRFGVEPVENTSSFLMEALKPSGDSYDRDALIQLLHERNMSPSVEDVEEMDRRRREIALLRKEIEKLDEMNVSALQIQQLEEKNAVIRNQIDALEKRKSVV